MKQLIRNEYIPDSLRIISKPQQKSKYDIKDVNFEINKFGHIIKESNEKK